jgi:hypothetical protein
MKREFHILATRLEGQFVMEGIGEGYPRVFPSLTEAARHARSQPDSEDGLVVIYDEEDQAVNRIPLQLLKLS